MITGVELTPTIGELVAAVATFQKNLPKVAKGNTADVQSQRGSFKYQYADLTDVSAAILPQLADAGLAWITMPNTHESGGLFLDWMLAHTSGENIRGSVPIGHHGDRWQDIGSAETYARRYCLVALTGVAPGGDDNDAEGVSAGSAPKPEPVKEYLPTALYDLDSLQTQKDAETMFYRARGEGHLNHIVALDGGTEVLFGAYLRDLGSRLPAVAAEDEPAAEATGADGDAEQGVSGE